MSANPNSYLNPAKPTDLIADIQLGTADDGPALNQLIKKAREWSNKITDDKRYFWIDLGPSPLFCETTIKAPGQQGSATNPPVRNLGWRGFGTEARTLGPDPSNQGSYVAADQYNVLGAAKDRRCRNRAHWQLPWIKHWKFESGFEVRGPHTPAQRNKSENSVLEQQAGIWSQSATDLDISGIKIINVWGDHVGSGTVVVYGQPCTGLKMIGGLLDRNGRECVLLTSWADALIQGVDIQRHSSQVFHAESGQGKTIQTGPWIIKDNIVSRSATGSSYFLHVTGGAAVSSIWVQGNMSVDQIDVYVDPSGDLPDPEAEKINDLVVVDNVWAKVDVGGYVLNARDITHVTWKRQKGPYRKIYSPEQVLHTERCDTTDLSLEGCYPV